MWLKIVATALVPQDPGKASCHLVSSGKGAVQEPTKHITLHL